MSVTALCDFLSLAKRWIATLVYQFDKRFFIAPADEVFGWLLSLFGRRPLIPNAEAVESDPSGQFGECVRRTEVLKSLFFSCITCV